MANYNSLKATVNANIKANNNQEITGPVLNTVLTQMINSLGAGYQFMGIATPSLDPGTPDQKVFYIAAQKGTYANFGNSVVGGGLCVLAYDTAWRMITFGEGLLEMFNGGIVFNDNKTAYAPISYFSSPFKKGMRYRITNLGDVNCSVVLYDANKNTLVILQQGFRPGDSYEFIFNRDNVVYIGGWANSFTYRLGIAVVLPTVVDTLENSDNVPTGRAVISGINAQSTEFDEKLNTRQYAACRLTEFELRNGYIHANASAGFIPNDNNRCTYPIPVNKGTILRVKYKWGVGGDFTGIARTNAGGTSYTTLMYTSQGVEKYGYRVLEYTATEDMYVCLSGMNTWLHFEIDTSGCYATKRALSQEATFDCTGSWQHYFPIIKGHRYLVKNVGANNTTFFTRFENDGDYGVNGGLVDKVVSEQTADQVIPSNLLSNSWTVFVASDNASYIVGYCGTNTTQVSIKDLGSVDALGAQYSNGILARNYNILFQSREGRVSSVYYPNNSKWGIAEAARNQYDRIRFTIRKTTDGVFFLCHNNTINSVARNRDGSAISGSVSSEGRTLAELNNYDWGILYGEKFAGMTVPLLEDALYYSALFNLGVTFEINSDLAETDYPILFNLAAKYGLLDSLILVPFNAGLNDYFKARNKKVNYWWGGTYGAFPSWKETLKNYLTGENSVYIYNNPYDAYPSEEYVKEIWANGFKPHFTNVFNKPEFFRAIGNHMALIDVANVPMVKSTLREYADSLVI